MILNRVKSISFIAALPLEERAMIIDQVKALMASEPALIGKSVVTFPYETAAFDTVKLAE